MNEENQNSRDIFEIPDKKMEKLIQEYIESLITVPLIDFLEDLIDKGANPLAEVEKTKFYRELDEQKRRTKAPAGEAREGIQAGQGPNEEIQIDTTQQNFKEETKIQKDVLA